MAADPAAAFRPGSLLTRFVAPPFSVLDTRQGYWQERRRSWLSLGIRSELGRGADAQALATGATREGGLAATTVGKTGGLISAAAERREDKVAAEPGLLYDDEVVRTVARMGTDYDTTAGENAWGGSGTSIFDPVLCELAYRWWAPEGGHVLDPFAGGSVRGLVAAKLGHPYTGIDLSGAQLEANRAQAAQLLGPGEPVPTWLHGDTLAVMPTLEPASFDMVMTCPPYYDLEVYSDDPADLSNVTWGQFVELYAQAMAASAHLLRPERFAVWVVSEIRDPEGYCRGLVPLTVQVAEAAGLRLYNEAVLVNSPGSLPVRVTRYMEASRKLGRSHQNVLCFVKGKPPRGWSYDRAAPPSPQLGLFEDEPGPVALEQAVVLASAEDLADQPVAELAGAAVLEALELAGVLEQDEPVVPWAAGVPLEGTAEWVADDEGLPEPEPWQLEAAGELTPVERHGAVWLKRDDLFEVAGVRGGKARSCWALAQGAPGLVTAGSRSSPQANIVAQVARELGIPARVHMPAGDPTPEMAAATAAGAAVVPHRPGHNSVIVARAREDAAARGWREVPFGMECREAVEATAGQVANLPSEAQRLVVPVGSGMSLAGILWGLAREEWALPVLGVVVGADPTKRLDRWAPQDWRERVELVPSGTDYHTPAVATSWPALGGVELDAHYEAKAAEHLRPGDVLWCVGIRQTQAGPPSDTAAPQPAPGPAAAPELPAEQSGATPEVPGPGASSAGRAPEPWDVRAAEALAHVRELEDGRQVDTSTGEILEPAPAALPVAAGLGAKSAISALPQPMPQDEWELQRGKLWSPGDPNRPCWTCGRPPTGEFKDGSPTYDHSHDAQVLSMFSDEEGTP